MSHGTPHGRRAPASKIGRNRTKCERYRSTNRREKNKAQAEHNERAFNEAC